MSFSNPVVGGTTLIREAIQSPDYVAGTSGWSINRDGTAEFNNVNVRGELLVSGAFGSYTHIWSNNLDEPVINMMPPDTIGNKDYEPAEFNAFEIFESDPDGWVMLNIQSPEMDFFGGWSYLELNSENGTETYPAYAVIAPYLRVEGMAGGSFGIYVDGGIRERYAGLDPDYGYPWGQSGEESITFAAAASFTKVVVFPTPFPAGTTPHIRTNIRSGAGTTARWSSRGIAVSNTQFTLFLQKGAAADGNTAWAGEPVQWSATLFPGSDYASGP